MFIVYKLLYEDNYYYIGVTNNLRRRLYEHGNKKNGYVLLSNQILFKSEHENDIYEWEKAFVNSILLQDKKCLNKTRGGRHPYNMRLGKSHTEKTKEKISKNRKGKGTGKRSKEFSNNLKKSFFNKYGVDNPAKLDFVKKKISKKLTGAKNARFGKPGTMLGKKLSLDSIKKISYIIQTPDGIFLSSINAANYYKISSQTILNRCYSKKEKFEKWKILEKGSKYQ